MSRATKLAVTAVIAAAAVAVPASPAMAWTAGPVSAALSGPMIIDAGIPASCTSATYGGSITAAGDLTITSATAECGVAITPSQLPWSGSLTGGVATISGYRVSGMGCTYGGSLVGSYVSEDESFPVTVTFTEQTVSRVSGHFLCPSSATITASYVFTQP
ncbi:hypothetical protein DPM19_23875 [Actinomadura craniellae]|uniref:Ig-like domain-containing protein n=1 Tax=Actinomadura craniellae TaxID=2231787 RepID=A0A365H0P4_9ACTN|nr:hypothetical protein [Actinomadura craniellae]RAY12637.1 hypothetical protein DPM19_23875 [Actinomadura craniellae]